MTSYFKSFIFLSSIFCVVSCKSQTIIVDTQEKNSLIINDTTFVNLKEYSQDFEYDMKYATDDNFLKAKVYDCAECFLRLKTVKGLLKANAKFAQKGYKIKIYDCYRPLDIQKKMWEIVPNPKYVANPAKGSIHNRGGAVDISLVTLQGEAVDMGTDFDFFGIEASHNYTNVSYEVKLNRKLLKSTMIKSGFNSFDSEWWHYNLKSGINDKVSNSKWDCK
ncbi:M15 family metallopeptidase [Flavobacterium glaciei]|uniref:D-alanyl-D-alanine dipeptidase n=1 Tax=Flavobacterium glaciei TaxID=386300 RepID=A0A562PJK5_9FLAO|nr:M15 family metallopeptidase [Flavobacterium glaciei]RDI50308.1 D-alanyl-D-alanine dipeptidase [Flavobacterium glaciei]TWI44558.1 D-alanyl-D-alanine dipeptidase [Flavobacterium glaciei]